ncbi:MAG: hypothetical protein AABZ44_05310, partial [Elusimicrobiota bacterium]
KTLIDLVEDFVPIERGSDRRWVFFLKVASRWSRLDISQYDGVYYLSGRGFEPFSCPTKRDVAPEVKKRLPIWIKEVTHWKTAVAKNPIAAQALLLKRISLYQRQGVIQRKNVRILLPGWMPVSSELTGDEKRRMAKILQRSLAHPIRAMTLDRFLDYCRVAYQANPATFKEFGYRPGLSGRKYYEKYADGRHGGLLDIKPGSAKAFERWHRSKSWSGSHPWEIYRGGNSTHIDMYVMRAAGQSDFWEVHLCALSSTRLVETCRIALALTRSGLPVIVDDAESYHDRILDQDWVGVIPENEQIGYGWQSFPREWGVRDCVHLGWLYEAIAKSKVCSRRQLRDTIHFLPEDITVFLKNP